MKKILLLILLPLQLFGQNTIGLPDVINYSKQTYSAGLQNWDIKQDKNGRIYIANNEGLLCFDGMYWTLYPLPNKTIVRSVEIGFDHKVYVGGQDELGYFEPTTNGKLKYHSLSNLISAKDKSFGDVWDIISFHQSIFFRTPNRIFKLSNNSIANYKANYEWAYLGVCHNKLYAHDYRTGLKVFENDVWVPLLNQQAIPINDPVTAILPMSNGRAIISTLKHGLFIQSDKGVSPLVSKNNALFSNERIYAATPITKDRIALGTSNAGIYIIDLNGNIIQSFSRKEGLQNNNVLSIFLDKQLNLWLGLDNGVDLIAYNSAIKQINPLLQDGSGYAALIHQNRLFLGTSNGLYSAALQQMEDLSFSKGNFVPVDNTKGQVWGLAKINNELLMGHHEGAFLVKDNKAKAFANNAGYWNFVPLSETFPTSQMAAGNYNGLSVFDMNKTPFKPIGDIPKFRESSRFIAIDKDNALWVSHPYHGVYKLSKKEGNKYEVFTYTNQHGLPSRVNNHVYKIKNEVVVATEKGVYNYNASKNRFEPSAYYNKLLGNQSLRYLKEDAEGNIWFIHEKNLGIIDFTKNNPVVINLPELNNKMLGGFELIYPVNAKNILIGGEKGFFNINYEKYKKITPKLEVQVRTVRIINTSDSILFGGYYKNVNEKQIQNADQTPEINYQWKTVRFEFSSSLFTYRSNLEYSFRLKGFDDNWSPWNKRTDKEYTNLPEGSYQFEVKVRNNLGNESAIASYSFGMLPPWYRSFWAYIIYIVLIISAIISIQKWQKKKFLLQAAKHEEEQNRLLYIHELELNKTENELVALRNEKLEAEINFKNSELASSAMHLVKKGELLTKSKNELAQLMKELDNPQAIGEIKKLIKSLSADENMDKEWENFAKHFDKVHSDYLVVLKEKHPDITPNELKLCAYLRMNLSTKEIAQLINISVRGVEISRYRLRKKLGIASEMSIFDYLINLNGNPPE